MKQERLTESLRHFKWKSNLPHVPKWFTESSTHVERISIILEDIDDEVSFRRIIAHFKSFREIIEGKLQKVVLFRRVNLISYIESGNIEKTANKSDKINKSCYSLIANTVIYKKKTL